MILKVMFIWENIVGCPETASTSQLPQNSLLIFSML